MPEVAVSKKIEPSKITWGPVVAVVVTVVIYFLSQFLASVVLLAVSKVQGWDKTQVEQLTNQTLPQFFYILMVEGVTLGLLWFFLRRRKANFRTLGLVKPHWGDLSWALTGFAIYLPILLVAMAAFKAWFPQVNLNQPQQVGFSGAHGGALVLVFMSLVILPPVTEEILTRGFLYAGLKTKLPVIAAALLTSVIFASAHLQFGSGVPLLWAAAIDTFVLSLVLVFLREKTGRLWASIGLHMLKNGIAFAALFIFVK